MKSPNSHTIANRQRSRQHLDLTTSLLLGAADSVEEWDRYDLGHALRAIALDFDAGGERLTTSKRRRPGQPSPFVANRLRARVERRGKWNK